MSSNDNKVDNANIIPNDELKNNNHSVAHILSGTILIQRYSSMNRVDITKLLCFLCLSLLSIIGGIAACLTSHIVSPYVPQPPEGPVDGEWSDWNNWSPCSINCSSHTLPLGNMTRTRFCNSPPPQLGGKYCPGVPVEQTECFQKPCPIPIDGDWAEWSPWSSCSGTCQTMNSIPAQTRSSSCSNPAPKDGGKSCEGDSTQSKLCTWLIQCPVDGEWGEWIVAGACESVNRKACALGKKLYQRQCNNPLPSGAGSYCQGLKEKNEDCWFDIGCPVGLQPPLSVQVFGNSSGLFEIQWSSVPYGAMAVKYRIYLTVVDLNLTQIETIHMNITSIPPTAVTGRKYSITADMKRFLQSGNFATLTVRISSFDYWDNESTLSNPVQSRATGVDGQWGEWDHWSECSTHCINKRGTRYRKRKCDNPAPTAGGKNCLGNSENDATCLGMEKEC